MQVYRYFFLFHVAMHQLTCNPAVLIYKGSLFLLKETMAVFDCICTNVRRACTDSEPDALTTVPCCLRRPLNNTVSIQVKLAIYKLLRYDRYSWCGNIYIYIYNNHVYIGDTRYCHEAYTHASGHYFAAIGNS